MSEEIFRAAYALAERGNRSHETISLDDVQMTYSGMDFRHERFQICLMRVRTDLPDERYSSEYEMLEVMHNCVPVYLAMEVLHAPGILRKERASVTPHDVVKFRRGEWESKLLELVSAREITRSRQ